MANREEVKASELKEGDKIFFPNSRHAQVLSSIETVPGGDLRLRSGIEVAWMVPTTHVVERETD